MEFVDESVGFLGDGTGIDRLVKWWKEDKKQPLDEQQASAWCKNKFFGLSFCAMYDVQKMLSEPGGFGAAFLCSEKKNPKKCSQFQEKD